ncbi:alpha/beta hydrolase [Bosea sp. BK604]|uniref:alpha/beta hydrolase n=1 Tax=Bosea sp. BK604 TaxID=2512180 RepID=UPI00140505FC|nr:alpha/beta hydrolase [Bosea sp. BK604]
MADEIIVATLEHDVVEALREALTLLLDKLIAAGRGPQHLLDMVWEVPEPAAFHPSRHLVDLAYREVLIGFRPPITLLRSSDPGLTVRARIAPAQPVPDKLVRGYSLPQLGRQYSPRLQADMLALFRQWSRDGDAYRATHPGLDLAYGEDRFETLDLFKPDGVERPPVWVLVHGGYWQASDKLQHAQFARGMVAAGYAVALPNYGLAPDNSVARAVTQTVAALNFLAREADSLGVDGSRLHLCGHSAGAHLAAMALCEPDAPRLRSALLLSGLYELEPLGHLPLGRLLGFDDPDYAMRLSPRRRPPPSNVRLELAVGEGESDEFKWQSAALADAWGVSAPLVVSGANHFSLLDGLNGGSLLDLARSLATDEI